MNAADAAPIARQAQHNVNAGWTWCFVRPDLVLEMARAVIERDAALERLAKIDKLALDALVGTACGTCYCEVLRGIGNCAKLPLDKKSDP